MGKLISGRVKKTPQTGITSDRYEYLGLDQAEPNLGDPLIGPSSIGAKPIPPGQQYILVSTGIAGDRYWIPNQGGIIPGSISIYNEDSAGPAPNGLVGGLSSTTQLIFIGNAVSAQGFLTNDGFPAPNVNVTISPPGNNGSVLFKESNDFATSSDLVFNSSVGILTIGKGLNVGSGGTILSVSSIGIGIKTTNATQELDVNGDLRLRGTIYDFNNEPGTVQQLLIKNSFGGLVWVNQSSIVAGAGGTFTNIQYHNSAGIVGGASNFVFDDINNRIGIGSTQPRVTLDVLGISSFIGGVNIDNLNVSGVSTFAGITTVTGPTLFTKQLNVSGLSTFAGITTVTGTTLFAKQLNVSGVTTSTTFIGALTGNVTGNVTGNINAPGVSTFTGTIDANGDLDVDGNTELDNVNISENLYVVGLSTLNGTTRINGTLRVFGDTTLSNTSITNLTSQQVTVTGLSTFAGITTVTGVTLFTRQLSVSGVSTFGGITTVTGETLFTKQLSVSGVSTVSGNIFAADDEAYDIGSDLKKFNVVYARLFFGAIIGNSETATSVIGGIANVNSLFVAGISTFNGHIRTNFSDTYNIGSSTFRFNNVYANAFNGSSGTITNFNSTNGNISSLSSNYAEVVTLDVTDLSSNNGNFDTSLLALSIETERINVIGISTFRNIIPSTDNTYDLGETSNRWNTVYANSFVGNITGNITGNADSATRLFNARNFSITGDVDATAVSFDGTDNVNLVTTLDSTGVVANTYGSSTTIPVFAVDAKGRITSVTNTSVNFSTATVAQSDTIKTVSSSATVLYPTFVNSNNDPAGYESLFTDDSISYNASTNLLTLGNITVSDTSVFNGNVTLGDDANVDTVTFTSKINSNVLPSTNASTAVDVNGRDLGGTSNYWRKIYARQFDGQFIGNADTVTKLLNARNIAITGDLSWNVNFDGSVNVTSVGTLANSGVVANTYGSSTTVPVFTVDAKGRITSVTNTSVNFSTATVLNADKLTTARNIAITGDLSWNVNFDGSTNVTSVGTLANSGVVANTYGSSTTVPVFTVDAKGRITSVTNTSVNFTAATVLNADKLTTSRNIAITGDLSWNVNFDGSANVTSTGTLANSGVVANTYGSSTTVPVFTVDAKGRITSVTNTGVNFTAATVLNADKLTTARNIAITGDLSWNVNFDGSGNVTNTGTLANSGVTAATYGSSSTVPVFTVDSKGRITSVTNTGITGINAASISAAGANTQVQFNDNGFFAGNSNFTFNKTTNVLSVPTLSGNVTGCTFSNDAVNKANIKTRTDSGFYEHDTATIAEGWPIDSNTWMHMLACTHVNDANYYSMQIAASFFNQTDLYYRSTNANGETAWSKIWHSNNDGSGSGLDADLLDGLHSSTSTTGNTIVARDVNGDDSRRYGFGSYFNSTDDVSTGTISHIMAKFGDNYYRSATAEKVATFISGQTMNINGNATTSTNLTGNGTNWVDNGRLTAVVGELAWKNYGNSHAIFDASAGTAPNWGSPGNANRVISNTNSEVVWSARYPTLMGWNGSNTYGVRVDSARVADTTGALSGYSGTFWTSNNDGAGSSLDADLLDGINSTSFARVDSSSIFTVPTYFQSNLGATSGSLDSPPLQAYSTGNNSAFMSFHKSGVYAVNFGLDSDNILRIGGWSAAANRWQLDMNGNMTVAGELIANSDIKLKENIEIIPNALEKVSQIRGVTFTRNDQEDKEKRHAGVIAQEVEKVLPEVVMEGNDGIKSVAYGNLVSLLIEAIKEQQEQINNLTDEINKLKK